MARALTIDDVARAAAARVVAGDVAEKSRPLPCGRDSPTSKTMQHGVVPRRTQVEKRRETMERLGRGDQ